VSIQYFRFSARAEFEARRAPLLEQLLARADGFTPVTDWRADAFRVIAPQAPSMPAVAPTALYADGAEVNGLWVCIAAPVHYVAEMNNVRLAQDGILTLRREEAEALALDFNRVWSDSGLRLSVGRSAHLYCVFDQALNVTTRDPEDVIDRHIEEYLPAGLNAPNLRQLMSELEMWLFEHAVNRARAAQGLAPISGLWLWGGGAVLSSLPTVQGFCGGEDVFFNAFKGEKYDGGVIVAKDLPGSRAWQHIESQWLKPAVALLRSGRISRLDLSAGNRCCMLSRRATWRLWRRPKPWWESFA
jgi:hypothetical protein